VVVTQSASLPPPPSGSLSQRMAFLRTATSSKHCRLQCGQCHWDKDWVLTSTSAQLCESRAKAGYKSSMKVQFNDTSNRAWQSGPRRCRNSGRHGRWTKSVASASRRAPPAIVLKPCLCFCAQRYCTQGVQIKLSQTRLTCRTFRGADDKDFSATLHELARRTDEERNWGREEPAGPSKINARIFLID